MGDHEELTACLKKHKRVDFIDQLTQLCEGLQMQVWDKYLTLEEKDMLSNKRKDQEYI